jgi:AcrR family transcriptional regulator
MSPRRLDPAARAQLLEIGARLLATEGPQALSARRIAAESGRSTMPLYSHFGGMSGLVRSIVAEGFERMHRYFTMVPTTDDPVATMALFGRAYRHNALANPHLYAVMFGGGSLAGYSLSEEERQLGRYTLLPVIDCSCTCIAAGRFRDADPELVATHMWVATHGLVTLELGGYLIPPYDAERLFESQLVALMVGMGDDPRDAEASVAASMLMNQQPA